MVFDVGQVPISGSAAEAVTVSGETTLIVISLDMVQPFWSVTVRVYVVVASGFAVGLGSMSLLSPSAGVQRYVYPGSPPPTVEVICATDSEQVPIELSSTASVSVSAGRTVMVMSDVAVQPLASVTVTV